MAWEGEWGGVSVSPGPAPRKILPYYAIVLEANMEGVGRLFDVLAFRRSRHIIQLLFFFFFYYVLTRSFVFSFKEARWTLCLHQRDISLRSFLVVTLQQALVRFATRA